MKTFHLRDVQETPDALRKIYRAYRVSLPKFKQGLVGPTMPSHMLECPGLVCFQNDLPACALLWKEVTPGIFTTEFYAEPPSGCHEAVELLLAQYLKLTERATARYFELWTPSHAAIGGKLIEHGFRELKRQLRSLEKPMDSAARWNEFRFISLRNLGCGASGIQALANFLHEAYQGTSDSEFYDEYKDREQCQKYLSRVLASPYCDFQNSWVAWSPQANTAAGLALCYIWPGARGLYLEQLAVHPSFRRKGLAKVLLSRVSSALLDGSLTRILTTVSANNFPALRLYDSVGAYVLDDERAFVRKSPTDEIYPNQEGTTLSAAREEELSSAAAVAS